jgi:hypothetical protein
MKAHVKPPQRPDVCVRRSQRTKRRLRHAPVLLVADPSTAPPRRQRTMAGCVTGRRLYAGTNYSQASPNRSLTGSSSWMLQGSSGLSRCRRYDRVASTRVPWRRRQLPVPLGETHYLCNAGLVPLSTDLSQPHRTVLETRTPTVLAMALAHPPRSGERSNSYAVEGASLCWSRQSLSADRMIRAASECCPI